MRISVIIPTHRRGDSVIAAVASAVDQAHRPVEVVVVDDAPDGAARAAVAQFERSRASGPVTVRYVENPERDGPSGSRNLGASVATGEWLAFLDDDDRWDPGYLDQVRAAGEAGADVVLTPLTRTVVAGSGRTVEAAVRQLRTPLTSSRVVGRNPGVTGSNLAIARSAFAAAGGYDTDLTFGEDTDLLARILDAGMDVAVTTDSLAHQLVHAGERLSTGGSRRLAGLEAFLRKHYRTASPSARRRMQFRYWGARKAAATGPVERMRFRLYAWSTAQPGDLMARVLRRGRLLLHRVSPGRS